MTESTDDRINNSKNMTQHSKTAKEERTNAITHGIGLVLALIMTPVLIRQAMASPHAGAVSAVMIFCFGMLTTYAASTIYHAVQHPKAKFRLQIWDHISIFFLIGGTYTAIVNIFLEPAPARLFLTVMWGIIAAGSVLKLFFTGRFPKLSTGLYVGLGWMLVFIAKPISETMPMSVFWWIMAGGLFYSAGVIFFSWRSLKYNHGIWHCFVLAGTAMHVVAVLLSLPLVIR